MQEQNKKDLLTTEIAKRIRSLRRIKGLSLDRLGNAYGKSGTRKVHHEQMVGNC
jgi:hypothetical protein